MSAITLKTSDNIPLLVKQEGCNDSMAIICSMIIVSSTFEELLEKVNNNGEMIEYPTFRIVNLDDACLGYVRKLNDVENIDPTIKVINALLTLAFGGLIGSALSAFTRKRITLNVSRHKSCSQIVREALAKRASRKKFAVISASIVRLVALYAFIRVENIHWPVFWTAGFVPIFVGSLIKYFI